MMDQDERVSNGNHTTPLMMWKGKSYAAAIGKASSRRIMLDAETANLPRTPR
jgi:hypothetical protein